jgi:predicted dehydrogenase
MKVALPIWSVIITSARSSPRKLISDGVIGDVTWFRGEHTGFLADPKAPATWRTDGMANGTMGDLAPHMINAPWR